MTEVPAIVLACAQLLRCPECDADPGVPVLVDGVWRADVAHAAACAADVLGSV